MDEATGQIGDVRRRVARDGNGTLMDGRRSRKWTNEDLSESGGGSRFEMDWHSLAAAQNAQASLGSRSLRGQGECRAELRECRDAEVRSASAIDSHDLGYLARAQFFVVVERHNLAMLAG